MIIHNAQYYEIKNVKNIQNVNFGVAKSTTCGIVKIRKRLSNQFKMRKRYGITERYSTKMWCFDSDSQQGIT